MQVTCIRSKLPPDTHGKKKKIYGFALRQAAAGFAAGGQLAAPRAAYAVDTGVPLPVGSAA